MLHSPCLVSNLSVGPALAEFIFLAGPWVCGILVPDQGLNPHPRQWKLGVLTTGLPGSPCIQHFWNIISNLLKLGVTTFILQLKRQAWRGEAVIQGPQQEKQVLSDSEASGAFTCEAAAQKLTSPRSATLASSPRYHNSCSAATAISFGPGFTCTHLFSH